MRAIELAIACAIGVPAAAAAQGEAPLPPAFEAPWTDVAPAIDRARDRVVAAAVGLPDERFARLAVRRAAARSAAEERARRAIHAWADDALAAIAAPPTIAAAVHRAIDRHARVARVRPLADGGAVVEIEVPLAALRDAAEREGLPWSRS